MRNTGYIEYFGNWVAIEVQTRIIKVKDFGDAYTATATLTIVDGEMHVEGLISQDNFISEDKRSIERYIRRKGFKYYISSHFKDKKRIIKKNWLTKETEALND